MANRYSAPLAVLLPEAVPGEVVRLIVAFIALFIGVRILMGLLCIYLTLPNLPDSYLHLTRERTGVLIYVSLAEHQEMLGQIGARALLYQTADAKDRREPSTLNASMGMPAAFRLPTDFSSLRPTEAWIPEVVNESNLGAWGNRSYHGLARLKDTVSPAAASHAYPRSGWR